MTAMEKIMMLVSVVLLGGAAGVMLLWMLYSVCDYLFRTGNGMGTYCCAQCEMASRGVVCGVCGKGLRPGEINRYDFVRGIFVHPACDERTVEDDDVIRISRAEIQMLMNANRAVRSALTTAQCRLNGIEYKLHRHLSREE